MKIPVGKEKFCLHKKKIESLETVVHLCCLQKDNVFSLPGHLADQREEEQTKVIDFASKTFPDGKGIFFSRDPLNLCIFGILSGFSQ